jgi:hypothetical protein
MKLGEIRSYCKSLFVRPQGYRHLRTEGKMGVANLGYGLDHTDSD